MAKVKKPGRPKQVSHYDKCKAEWERRRAERKAQFAEAQRRGKPDDGPDDWRPGVRFVTPDPIQSDKGGGDWLVDPPELPLDAVSLVATLRVLAYHLQDQRYHDIRRDLIASGMIDLKTGKWSRWGTVLASPMTHSMCEMIEQSIATRIFTEREAIADAVKELGLDAASFDAACKSVKRLLNAYRKAVGQDPA
jgi:hypothetical protein